MKAAVVGGRGFIGQHLVRYLLASGHEVHSYSSQQPGVFDPKTGLLEDDFAFGPTDVVYYLSQSPYYREGEAHLEHLCNVNAISALRAVRKARRVGVRNFVFASTGNIYQASFAPIRESHPLNRANAYALSKIHGEELLALESKHVSVTCVRLFGVFGPNQKDMLVQKIAAKIRDRQPILVESNPHVSEDEEGIRISYLSVADLVRLLEKLPVNQKQAFLQMNVAGPEAVSLRRLAHCIGDVLGIPPIVKKSAEPRRTDLIADISLLNEMMNPQFSSLTDALNDTFSIAKLSRLSMADGGLL